MSKLDSVFKKQPRASSCGYSNARVSYRRFYVSFSCWFLDALCPNWKAKLIGVSRVSNMTQHISGVVPRLHQICLSGCYRVCCAVSLMNSAVQKVFDKVCNDAFITALLEITGHLRRQQKMTLEMKSHYPRFSDTR